MCYHDTAAYFELFREWFGPVSTIWHMLEEPTGKGSVTAGWRPTRIDPSKDLDRRLGCRH